MLPLQGTWVQSLVGELRPPKVWCSQKKKKKKPRNKSVLTPPSLVFLRELPKNLLFIPLTTKPTLNVSLFLIKSRLFPKCLSLWVAYPSCSSDDGLIPLSWWSSNVTVYNAHMLSWPRAWTVACQAPLSMGFPRQEHESGLLFPSAGDLPHPGIESASPALPVDSLPLSNQGWPVTF